MYVKQLNVASMRFVVQIITIVLNANVSQAIVAIHKLNVCDLNARQTLNVPIIWRVSLKSVEIHAIVVKGHCVALTIIELLADVHLAILAILVSVVQLSYMTSQSVAWMAIVPVNWLALVAFVRILVSKPDHVLSMQVVVLLTRYRCEQWFVLAIQDM